MRESIINTWIKNFFTQTIASTKKHTEINKQKNCCKAIYLWIFKIFHKNCWLPLQYLLR